ncbi:MAG: hypothetical protein PHT07_19245 [Paludibacter sp.]|nr:hypothetical protein [Paludibacter sp.]
MTHEDFITFVRRPETVKTEYDTDLKELVERYPYFVPARLLLVKTLQQSHSIHYAANLRMASVYCSSRRWLYYYLYPEKLPSTEPYQRNKNGKSSGDYFDMINVIELEGGDTKQSLKNLAERLKSARSMVIAPKVVPDTKPVIRIEQEIEKIEKEKTVVNSNPEDQNKEIILEITESNAKKLIAERKYKEAIEILRALNLNNPKKSVYFADQIRFLEKVIVNSKK